jgi:hypothetical protein
MFICRRPFSAVLAALVAAAAFVVSGELSWPHMDSMNEVESVDSAAPEAGVDPQLMRPTPFTHSLALRSSDRDSPEVVTPRD